MNEFQQALLDTYQSQLELTLKQIVVGDDGEHVWDNYQKVTAILLWLQEVHNEIASLEITGQDWAEIKKFRTLIVDPTIERLEKVAAFESRKITGKQMEKDLER